VKSFLRKSDGGYQGESRLLPLISIIMLAGCALTPMAIPGEEINGLLKWQREVGLSQEQVVSLRTLVERSSESQSMLERHLIGEQRTFDRLMAQGHAIDAPDLWAQAGLVHQLRIERLLAPVVLRQQARTRLTDAQLEWLSRNRLLLIFPP
jgi:hypothetical protein